MKGNQDSKNQKTLEFTDWPHGRKIQNALRILEKIEIIGTNQTIILEEAMVNLISQHLMNIFIDHDNIVS